MGIQLPPELADVAAQAGVKWPEADEDRLRQQAQAWRDAGTKLTNLTRDADHTASGTLHAVTGSTGDAARRHWSTFVAPDTGHLTATAHGCNAAADRLDHAAQQVGTAKVEIVRNLVNLARNSDAAHTASAAGHPHALLGLDTAVRATNANVTHITNTLATAVVPATGVDMNSVQPLVNPNPGHHQGPLTSLTGTVQDLGQTATGTVQDVTQIGANQGPGHHGPLQTVTTVAGGAVHDLGQVAADPGQALPADPRQVPGRLHDALPQPIGDGGPPLGHPDTTGPVRIPPDAAHLPHDAPTPPTGIPAAPGQTVQAGLAGPLLDPSTPAQVPPGAVAAPAGGAPAANQAFPAAPTPAGPPPPAAGGSILGPAAPARPAAPIGGLGTPAVPASPGPSGPGAPARPIPSSPAAPGTGGGPAAPARPGAGPISAGPAPGGPAAPASPAPPGAAPRPSSPADAALGRGPMSTAVPPGPQGAWPPHLPVPKERRDDAVFLFWVHMFPIGHMPVKSDRPARQLPQPPAEVDFAAGLRFPPGDHPNDVRPTPSDRVPIQDTDGLVAEHPTVRQLAEGHDPLGGQHERDWDRRYLVRLGSVTPQGISSAGKEYAWPPGESYPEGGTADGEPETLPEGTLIDRFGDPSGRVFSAAGTAFARRSLPPEQLRAGYHRYRVSRALPVWRTVSAPWFGQPGGGERYRATYSATELMALGYLEDIT